MVPLLFVIILGKFKLSLIRIVPFVFFGMEYFLSSLRPLISWAYLKSVEEPITDVPNEFLSEDHDSVNEV